VATPRIGLTKNTASTTLADRIVNDDANIDAMDDGSALYLQDDIASRPAAGIEGRYFWSIDESLLYYDDGAAWHCVAAGSATQGSLPYVDAATKYALLAPGTAHYPLVSGGAGANPGYESISEILDALIGSTRGGLLCRGAGGWVLIEPDTAGYVLTDGGAGADPAWATLATLLNQILTTRGDLLYRGSGDAARLAKGSQYSVLSMGADDPAWTYLYSTRILVLPATAFNLDAANPPEEYLLDGTNQEVATLAFDATTEETAQAPAFVVPADINTGGTVTFALVGWAKTAAADKNVQFRVKQLVLSSGAGSVDTAYSTASDSGDLACNATQNRPVIYTWTATVSSLGWSAGQRVRLAISRIAPSANNLTGDFLVESFEVRVPTRVM